MPGYKVHMVVGVLSAIVFSVALYYTPLHDFWKTFSGLVWVLILPVILCYAVAPDVDIRTSVAFKLWGGVFGVVMVSFIAIALLGKATYLLTLCAGLLSFAFLCSMFLGHRGIMHRYWMGVLVSAPLYLISPYLMAFGLICYGSHIAIDGARPDKR